MNGPIYRTEVLIIRESKNYSGVIDLYENRCVVYNDDKVLDEFGFDIAGVRTFSWTSYPLPPTPNHAAISPSFILY